MKLTNEEFINKAKSIHGDKYDYSNTQYINSRTKVIIICPIHGGFIQRPDQHLAGCGCPKCGHKRELKEEDIIKRKNIFLQRAKNIHNNKYDYSKVNYINVNTKVCIICPEHGEFWTTPERHVSNKVGCPVCKSKTQKCHKYLTNEEFIKKAKEIHGDKYNYSKINYINGKTKICIICPEHGEFLQKPSIHLLGCECPKCGKLRGDQKLKLTTEKWIEKAKKIHGDKYDYSKVEYKNHGTKVCIICPEHGEFWQKAEVHVSKKHRCPKCGVEENFKIQKEIGSKNFNETIEKLKHQYIINPSSYIKNNEKISVICKKHGEFLITPHKLKHLKTPCPKCKEELKKPKKKNYNRLF